MNSKIVLCLMAHPDDPEIWSGGTLAFLARAGWKVVTATMTLGQAGSTTLNSEEISAVRRKEAAAAAAVIDASYYCLESEDIFITYDKPTLLKVITLFRKIRPTLVITASPNDYMLDHEITSQLAQTACIAAAIPNIQTPGLQASTAVPHLYYADAAYGKDRFGNEIIGSLMVDISSVMDVKIKMVSAHLSQRDWLSTISGVDEFVRMIKSFSERNGKFIDKPFAEGYRQHLGFSYPQDDLLGRELSSFIHYPHIL